MATEMVVRTQTEEPIQNEEEEMVWKTTKKENTVDLRSSLWHRYPNETKQLQQVRFENR